ncbi:MAG: twin-arginine translocase subunit TatC [Nitrospirota bacterium]|nr:twin-arginine translocase subunit TatC [Nitrospirota bacterium]
MPFLLHLGELRVRLMRAALAVLIASVACFAISERIIHWLARPLSSPLVFITPGEPFWANMKVAFMAGLLLSMPVVLYQVWRFVEPGLHPDERRLGGLFVTFASLLFAGGMAFCAWVVLPFTIGFLLGYKTDGLQAVLSVGTYVDFCVKFFLAFGIIFELPPLLVLLSRMGVVTPEFLSRNRRYAVLLAFVVAAVLTPTPDVFNQLLMAAPLIVLYEVGVLLARWFGRQKRRAATRQTES